jgi:hypothetical protein
VSNCAPLYTNMRFCQRQAHKNGQSFHGLKPLNPWDKINLSSFEGVCLLYFVSMMEGWLTHQDDGEILKTMLEVSSDSGY